MTTTLIVYTTRHGCTDKCAKTLRRHLSGDVDVMDLKGKKAQDIHLESYDTVVIGGSIHAGLVQKKVKAFCRDFNQELKTKVLGLFLCCMEQGRKAQEQFEQAFPQDLREHATASSLFGGEFDFTKMNVLERGIVKKVAGIGSSVSRISEEAIAGFARDILAAYDDTPDG